MIKTSRLTLRPWALSDADALLSMETQHRDVLAPKSPLRDEIFYTREGQETRIQEDQDREARGVGYAFAITALGGEDVLGRIALSNIVRGAWHSATLGYWVDPAHWGEGIATEAVLALTTWAFQAIDLHRIQAAVMPRNLASLRVLEKAGYLYEGFAPYYLQINGVWEDHKIYSITVEDFDTPADIDR